MSKLVFLTMYVAGFMFAILNLAACQFQTQYAERLIEMSDSEMNITLKIRCQPRGSINKFSTCIIYRWVRGADLADKLIDIKIDPDTLALKTIINGEFNMSFRYNLSIGVVSLDLNYATCEDSGVYYCTQNTTQPTAKNSYRHTTLTTVKIEVLPGEIQMTAVPDDVPLKLDSILKLICNGRIGSNGSEVKWVWEFRDNPSIGWTEYVNQADITTSNAEEDPLLNCRLRQESILTRKVNQYDLKREYRCYVRRRTLFGTWKSYEQFGAVYPRVKGNTSSVKDEEEFILESGEEKRTIRKPLGAVLMAVLIGLNIVAFIGYIIYSMRTRDEPENK